MIIKSLLGGTFVVFAVGWLVWVIIPQDECERIHRSGSVVRMPANLLREVLEPSVSTNTRLDMIRWSLQAENGFKKFVAWQFFRNADCSRRSKDEVKDEVLDRMMELLETELTASSITEELSPPDDSKEPQ